MKKNDQEFDKPYLLNGDVFMDTRGKVSFVNDFNFSKIKRFYIVENHKKRAVRAWHGHQHEAKYVFAVSGEAKVGAVKIDNWKNPSKNSKVYSFLLSSKKPAILYVPKGYANGFESLTADAKLIFFSTSTFDESKKDDFRFDPKYWDIWS